MMNRYQEENTSTVLPIVKTLLAASFVFIVAACGGSGGGDVAQDPGPDDPVITVANQFFTTISADVNVITQNGTETAVITVQAIDDNQNNLKVGGDSAVLATTLGSLSAVTDNNDGTYSATLTISSDPDLLQGLSIITGTINGDVIGDHAGVANRIDRSSMGFMVLAVLGQKIFEDTNLSESAGVSCATCHDASFGFAEPDFGEPTSLGAGIGTRNAQTASYAAHIPQRQIIADGSNTLIGGQFWDGRASTLEDQAKQPFTNPLEMANVDDAAVITKLKAAALAGGYEVDFNVIFSTVLADVDVLVPEQVDAAMNQVVEAIAAFQRTKRFTKFNSVFDDVKAGSAVFSASAARGELVFNGKGDCSRCHFTPTDRGEQVFSNFEYFNIGVPANADLLLDLLDPEFIDNGLGGVDGGVSTDNGKFRVPSLRNIADTAPYMHNGVFTSLVDVIDFYNGELGGAPEVNANLDSGGQYIIGGMTIQDKADLKAFLETLSDRDF